jgi:hypothetical protein
MTTLFRGFRVFGFVLVLYDERDRMSGCCPTGSAGESADARPGARSPRSKARPSALPRRSWRARGAIGGGPEAPTSRSSAAQLLTSAPWRVSSRLSTPSPTGCDRPGEGADFRAPLGRALIGGVITSTLLTLLVIPTVYEILDNLRSWLREKVWRRVIRTHPEPAARPAASE